MTEMTIFVVTKKLDYETYILSRKRGVSLYFKGGEVVVYVVVFLSYVGGKGLLDTLKISVLSWLSDEIRLK